MNNQPTATPAMRYNLNPKNLPLDSDGRRGWSNGLFDCFGDCGTCCVAWWCPCITYGKVKRRHEHLVNRGAPDPEQGGCCTSECMIHALIASCGFGFVMQFMLRGELRNQYRINGGACNDCLAALCCTPCELTQESRELEAIEATYGKY